MKLPNHIVQNLFYRLGIGASIVKSSSVFVHKAKCPICQDHKQRLYLREYGTFYSVKCHNCGFNGNFESFLKEYYPSEYDEIKPYILESLKDGSVWNKNYTSNKEELKKDENIEDLIDIKLKMYLKNHSFPINVENINSKKEELRKRIIEYLEKRRIPEQIYNDFVCIVKGPLRGYIGIPFFDESKQNIIHLQGRLFVEVGEGDHPKYMFLRDKLDGIELENKELWGLWRASREDEIIICEGTLDACAFEKGIATCGATMGDTYIENLKMKYPQRIWCIDSFWSDIEGRKLTTKLLESDEKCFIIPKNLHDIKDANDLLCKYLKTDYIPLEFIKKNTYKGNLGLSKLRFSEISSLV